MRPRPLADEIGASPSGLYGWISKGVVEARRINGIVVIPNHEARRLLGMPALERRYEQEERETARRIGMEAQAAA